MWDLTVWMCLGDTCSVYVGCSWDNCDVACVLWGTLLVELFVKCEFVKSILLNEPFFWKKIGNIQSG